MSVTVKDLTNKVNVPQIFENGCAWIDNQFLPIEKAGVPILDVGFAKSDCTYDVVATWNGKFFRLEDHLNRFQENWEKLKFNPPVSRSDMKEILFECVRRSGLRNSYVEMIVTRGIPENGERDPRKFSNKFYAFAIPYVWIVKPDDQLRGIHISISTGTVRIDPKSVDPKVKNFHWGDMTRALFEAYEAGAETVILPNSEGYITEGPGFNIFALTDGALWTPDRGVLEGITRKTVIEIADHEGIPVKIKPFKKNVLEEADEIFLTSTAGGIMPVCTLDEKPVGNGLPGTVFKKIHQDYWAAHDSEEDTDEVNYRDN